MGHGTHCVGVVEGSAMQFSQHELAVDGGGVGVGVGWGDGSLAGMDVIVVTIVAAYAVVSEPSWSSVRGGGESTLSDRG